MRATAVLLAVVVLLAACSGDGDDNGDAADGTATAQPTSTETAGTAAPGVTQTDASGNEITVHGWAPWPNQMALFDPYDDAEREESLYGNVEHAADPGSGLWAIDVEVCAAGDEVGGFWEFVAASGEGEIANVEPQILSPVFRWPAAGACARGWQGLEAPGAQSPVSVRYVGGVSDTLEWPLGEAVVPPPAEADWVLPAGQAVQLPEPLDGWTVTVQGWTEVGDTSAESPPSGGSYAQPIEGSRLIAALVDWCYELETEGGRPVPTFGVQIDGWNLMGDFLRGSPWGPGFQPLEVAPAPGCASGWVAFEVPLGSVPSGVFVSDNNNSDVVWHEWRFDESSILAQPEGGGLPDAPTVNAALEACGATAPLQVSYAGLPREGMIVSAAAIPTGPARLDVYLSGASLTAADIPQPVDPEVVLVALGLEQTDGSNISPGQFTGQVTGSQYGTVSLVPGGEGGGITIFVGATVELTEVTDTYVCGSITATAGADSINGSFGAPIWIPEG